MPRPQRDLDPRGGPLVEFARDLRALREAAGTPKFATMARRTGRSKTALADAAGGQHLPRWETVEDFVRACDADPAPWHRRWLALRAGDDAAAPAPVPPEEPVVATPDPPVPAPVPPAPVNVPGPAAAPTPRRRRALLVAAAVVGVLVVGVLGFVLGRVTEPGPPIVPQTVEAIVVQNKVALGPDRLVEDRTPAYLSTEALAYCAQPSRNCKVPGTEMGSGAAVVANCWTQGQMMWNWDLSDPTAQSNPDDVRSDLWYRASFPDGRTGYLSEVYVERGDRGGRGLPRCNP
ncbi:helix-turn-helix transcriptional regulator [Actinomycetospora sp. TBRC 11914]|uniref:helix-turn-helix domain-containing protein n=1 Tax=Actinomycetospora sp. TBRC 11914 TaxID=2729387 RepID=UPI00145D0BC8|nr:helix-turn-helix transcriptional regulator [Actinomycetospora sp. TBRC 11914]NMO90429.1 helix-turn-helix domain-containing protein [Actinomycetospora sp. TBRC 11914]